MDGVARDGREGEFYLSADRLGGESEGGWKETHGCVCLGLF